MSEQERSPMPPPLPEEPLPGPLPPVMLRQGEAPIATYWLCAVPTRYGLRAICLFVALMMGWTYTSEGDFSFVGWGIIALLAFLGLGMLEGGCRLDRGAKQIMRWYGIGFPWWRRSYSYDEVKALRLVPGKRVGSRADSKSAWCHVEAVTDRGTFLVRRFDYRPEGRQFAQRLAQEFRLMSIEEVG